MTWKDGVMTSLGTSHYPSNAAFFRPVAINRSGEVAGTTSSGQSVVWRAGTLTTLVEPGVGYVEANDMNDKGQIVGWAMFSGATALQAFLWENGTFTKLGTLLPGPPSCATRYFITDISDAGHVVGYRAVGASDSRAFVWRDGVDLTVGSSQTYGMSVNSRGEIAGYKDASVGLSGAYLWTVGRHGP